MPKKILVIDDEELIIKSLSRLLEKCGFDVVVVKRGQDALAIIEEDDFDLVISDVRMPGMDGVTVISLLLKATDEKQVPRPKVIFITGYADKEFERQANALNPAAYIHKPFDIATLVKKINEVLK